MCKFIENAPNGRSIYTDNTGRYFMVWGARVNGGGIWAMDIDVAREVARS